MLTHLPGLLLLGCQLQMTQHISCLYHLSHLAHLATTCPLALISTWIGVTAFSVLSFSPLCPSPISSTHSSESDLYKTQIYLFPSRSYILWLPITNRIKFKLLSLPLKGHPSCLLQTYPLPVWSSSLHDNRTGFVAIPYSFMPFGHCTHCHVPWNFLLPCAHV